MNKTPKQSPIQLPTSISKDTWSWPYSLKQKRAQYCPQGLPVIASAHWPLSFFGHWMYNALSPIWIQAVTAASYTLRVSREGRTRKWTQASNTSTPRSVLCLTISLLVSARPRKINAREWDCSHSYFYINGRNVLSIWGAGLPESPEQSVKKRSGNIRIMHE